MSSTAHPEALPHRRPMALPGWGVTLIALLILVAAVAAGVVIGNSTAGEASTETVTVQARGVADQATTSRVDDMLAAWSSGDGKETASYFTDYAVVNNDIGGYTLNGTDEIVWTAMAEGDNGIMLSRRSPVVESAGGYLSYAFDWSGGSGIIVLQAVGDGKYYEMWVHGY